MTTIIKFLRSEGHEVEGLEKVQKGQATKEQVIDMLNKINEDIRQMAQYANDEVMEGVVHFAEQAQDTLRGLKKNIKHFERKSGL